MAPFARLEIILWLGWAANCETRLCGRREAAIAAQTESGWAIRICRYGIEASW